MNALIKLDRLLETVNKYSMSCQLLQQAAGGIYRSSRKLLANADLVKAAGDIILKCLREIVKRINGFLYSVYYGSFVMEIAGRAAAGSRWLR